MWHVVFIPGVEARVVGPLTLSAWQARRMASVATLTASDPAPVPEEADAMVDGELACEASFTAMFDLPKA